MHIYTSLGQYRICMRLQYCPRDVQTIYVPWAIYDFHASIRPLGHIRFACIYTSLGSFRRPIWPDIFCKFHPLRGLYNRGMGIYGENILIIRLCSSMFFTMFTTWAGQISRSSLLDVGAYSRPYIDVINSKLPMTRKLKTLPNSQVPQPTTNLTRLTFCPKLFSPQK